MAFDAKESKIKEWLNDKLFYIPRNQRKYVWDQRKWREFAEDIFLVLDGKGKSHFIGSIVFKEENSILGLQSYTIIDGQQRLTTITIALTVLCRLFIENKMGDDLGATKKNLKARNDKNELVNIMFSDTNLVLSQIVNEILDQTYESTQQESFKSYIENILGRYEKENNICDAFVFFYNIFKKKINRIDDFVKLRDIVREIDFVYIIAKTDEDSYTIFEILNARGQLLEDYELLKNFILRYIEPQTNRDTAKIKWEQMENNLNSEMNNFISHYATHKYEEDKDGKKYKEPTAYKIISKHEKGKDAKKLLEDLLLKASFYKKLIDPANSQNSCLEKKYFRYFKSKRQIQFRPIILSLLSLKSRKLISVSEYESALSYIYSFFVCYKIIGKGDSNKLSEIIYEYAERLENHYESTLINKFKESIKKRFPPKQNFINLFKDIGYSNHADYFKGSANKDKVIVVLELIETYMGNNNLSEDLIIEHMLPDSDCKENSIIGNLIPLESDLNNKKCKDKELKDKYMFYKESSFLSARKRGENFSNIENITGFSIDKRTEYLANLVY